MHYLQLIGTAAFVVFSGDSVLAHRPASRIWRLHPQTWVLDRKRKHHQDACITREWRLGMLQACGPTTPISSCSLNGSLMSRRPWPLAGAPLHGLPTLYRHACV